MNLRRDLTRTALLLAGTGILLGLGACSQGQQAAAPQAPPVTVAQPTRGEVKDYMIFTGSTRAVESADVVARVAGELEEVAFAPSSNVAAGDLLFRIEETKYRADRDAARAALASAEANLLRSKTELQRVEKASRSRAVSEMDVDRARAERDMAAASVATARANLDQAELFYGYTRVTSPISGVVSRNLVDVGNLVGQGGPTLLTRVNRLQPIYVYFHAPENVVLRYLASKSVEQKRDGSDAERAAAFVARANDEGFPFPGVIDFIDNQVDPETGTIELRVRLENESLDFFPGLFVRLKVEADPIPDSVLVPETALGTDLGGKYLLVVGEGNIVEQKYVSLGLPQEGGLIHVRDGLAGDETIIVDGLMFARPGMPCTPLTAEQFKAMRQQAAAQAQGKQG
ncbi:efflux RND transporter periplasmic adaptor subunit [bacterium]|nr:efflux RND transporter periplasmic adaptor subunit [bacterium]